VAELPQQTATPNARLGPPPWAWMVLACVIIAASGLLRINQERAFADAARSAQTPPFPMRELPRELGEHWKMQGEEQELDPDTLTIAGCSDYMLRRYVDDRTGVALTVLVSFGPAAKVFPHSPIVCYPSTGFKKRAGPSIRSIDAGDDESARFSVLAFARPDGGIDDLRQVYYSYWHDGRWDPESSQTKNRFFHRPAMFKIQVERPITFDEIEARSSPIDEFLEALVPEIDRRIDEWERAERGDALAAE
jgi:hypothetical protein